MRTGSRDRRTVHASARAGWVPAAFSGPLVQTANFYLLLMLMVACAVGGGSSFVDVPSLLYVRPLAVVCLVASLLVRVPAQWRAFRAPLILFGLFAALMALQLVPLPPPIWTALPGRAPYVPLAELAGISQPWRPISLTPDLTMNSLVSLIVPAAVLACFVRLRADQRVAMVPVLVVLCCLSAMVGVAQFAGGRDSILYLYERTYEGFTVGFLANRNHHAALLAIVFPALRVWTLTATGDRAWARRRQWLALALGVLIIPVILATGSRAGIALTVLSIVASFLLFPPRRRDLVEAGRRPVLATLGRFGVPALLLGLVVLTYFAGRAASINRLVSLSDVDADLRFQFAPIMWRIIADTWPIGTGFGSFDPIFRQYEPDRILKSSYFNHAHNELTELTIVAGVAGLMLLAAFLLWWGTGMIAALRTLHGAGTAQRVARLGGLAIAFILLASLVDYPLRAPLMAYVFTVGCCWLCEPHAAGGVATRKELG